MISKLLKKYRIGFLSVAMGFVISMTVCMGTKAYSDRFMENLTSQVFRFHVLANSDSEQDQALKLMVRDEILDKYRYFLTSSHSKNETVRFFENRLDDIEKTAKAVLSENGCDYSVRAEVTKSSFPIRKYGDVTLPAGVYDCLKISIGKAQGHNWWCVMFPPLCYTEATYSEVKENTAGKALDSETAAVVLADREDTPKRVKVKLKIVELWQNSRQNDR